MIGIFVFLRLVLEGERKTGFVSNLLQKLLASSLAFYLHTYCICQYLPALSYALFYWTHFKNPTGSHYSETFQALVFMIFHYIFGMHGHIH